MVDGGAPQRSFAPLLTGKYGIDHRVHFTGKSPRENWSACTAALKSPSYLRSTRALDSPRRKPWPVNSRSWLSAGALPEVVGDDGAGILVPPRDAQALAQAIKRLLKDPELRQQMGRAARRRVLDLFTWENAARQMADVYREVIDAHR